MKWFLLLLLGGAVSLLFSLLFGGAALGGVSFPSLFVWCMFSPWVVLLSRPSCWVVLRSSSSFPGAVVIFISSLHLGGAAGPPPPSRCCCPLHVLVGGSVFTFPSVGWCFSILFICSCSGVSRRPNFAVRRVGVQYFSEWLIFVKKTHRKNKCNCIKLNFQTT